MLTIRIKNDPLSVGPAAGQDDLLRYAANLETHLTERFPGISFAVERASVYRTEVLGEPEADRERVEAYVRELERGDAWIKLLDE